MRALEEENDPRILKELIKLIVADNEKKQKFIDQILEQKQISDQKSFSMEESLAVLRKKFFGKSSEQSPDRNRSRKPDDEVLLHSQNIIPPVKEKSVKKLPEEVVIHEASSDELVQASKDFGINNPNQSQWIKVDGLFDQSTEIEIIERSFKKVIHKKQKYKLKSEFNNTDKDHVFISAEGPVKLIPGSSYSIDFAVSTVVDKYLNHLPLERQCRMMDSLGLKNMKPQVLYNLAKVVSIHLEPIVEKIKNEILNNLLIHSDETPWPISNSKDSDGYMWIIANNLGSYYRFEPTRSGKVVKETLAHFSGVVMTDGYSGYYQFRDDHKKNLNQNKLAMCHAHARRYFFEIKENYPVIEEYLILYKELLRNFGKLWMVEKRNIAA